MATTSTQGNHQSYADLLLTIIEYYWRWDSHAVSCDPCAAFSALPANKAEAVRPCEVGQKHVQALLSVLKLGL